MSTLRLEDILGESSVELEIDDYGYQGEGYVELEDGWVSVPGALPGERVRVDLEDETTGGRRVFARVTEILDGSERRRDPLCDRFDVCRGCQLRHLQIPEEFRFKRRTIREVVSSYADLPPDRQPEIGLITPRPTRRGDAFRIRSRLTYEQTDGAFELGLVTPRRPELVSMSDCPALTGATRRLVDYVRSALEDLAELPPDAEGGEPVDDAALEYVAVASPTFGRGLVELQTRGVETVQELESVVEAGPIAALQESLADRLPEDVGLAVRGGETRKSVKPPERITLPIFGLEIQAGYDDWFPATLDPTEVLYETLVDDILELDASDRFLDVGCGVGTLSLLVAPYVDTSTGIDINPHSIEAAELNAVRNDIHDVEFLPSGWEKALRELVLEGRNFDRATINPMRQPLGERPLAYLHELGLDQIVYLGPSPEAAAKDLGRLRAKGWNVERLDAANIHPATYHTLLVADLRRD